MSDLLQFHYENELRDNADKVGEVTSDRFLFRLKVVVELTFAFCHELSFGAHTRFLALEIFDHFLPKFLKESFEKCRETSQSWDSVLSNIERQIPMRILSCIQLASKYLENKVRLKPEQILSLLTSDSDNYWYINLLRMFGQFIAFPK